MNMHLLIIDARFYEDIADEMVKGAIAEIENQQLTYDIISVPGVFEIAAAINFAEKSHKFDGYIALGCVIRGQTSHYDYVCSENARALTDLAINKDLAIGYGVLTVENKEQAWQRAKISEGNKGSKAAIACVELLKIKTRLYQTTYKF